MVQCTESIATSKVIKITYASTVRERGEMDETGREEGQGEGVCGCDSGRQQGGPSDVHREECSTKVARGTMLGSERKCI